MWVTLQHLSALLQPVALSSEYFLISCELYFPNFDSSKQSLFDNYMMCSKTVDEGSLLIWSFDAIDISSLTRRQMFGSLHT